MDRIIESELNCADSSTSPFILSVKMAADPEAGARKTKVRAYLIVSGMNDRDVMIIPNKMAGRYRINVNFKSKAIFSRSKLSSNAIPIINIAKKVFAPPTIPTKSITITGRLIEANDKITITI